MAKTLELEFATEFGKVARVSLDNPKEPIDTAVVKSSMEQIISADVFTASSGRLSAVKSARVIDRNVTEYEIV